MMIRFVGPPKFLWMTVEETSLCPQCTGLVAAQPAVDWSGKTIMGLNWDFNCVCGVARALTTKPVVFECIHSSLE